MNYKLPEHWLGKPLKVAVLGCGGTGYYLSTALFQLERVLNTLYNEASFRQIDLYDAKTIKAPNLARTGYLPFEVGFHKAEILANRLNAALGYTVYNAHNENANSDMLIRGGYDLIITATDSIESRMMVANLASKVRQHTLWLDTGVDKATASCVLGELSCDKDRLPVTTDLFPRLPEKEQHLEPSCDMATSLARQAFGVNQQIAGQGVNLLAQLLLDGEIAYHGSMLDLKTGFASPIAVDTQIWASFGYERAA